MTPFSQADDNVLHADIRHRPPEMIIDKNHSSGPLKDVLDEAAEQVGYTINWRIAPFARTLKDLQTGRVDLVPRVIKTANRQEYIDYLGPIGYQQKDIQFLVRKGQENLLSTYEDLYQFEIGVKRDTSYFPQFNTDEKLNKVLSLDDSNMSSMFAANRFDAMIVLDKQSIEIAMKQINFTDYAYADYAYEQQLGIFYGLSKQTHDQSGKQEQLHQNLNKVLHQMTDTGRVNEIYRAHKLPPPNQN